MGDDTIYSGTLAAALEGRHLGLPAIAVSLDGRQHYETAARVVCDLIPKLHPQLLKQTRSDQYQCARFALRRA